MNAVDDSAFGEERRAETVEQLSKKLFDAGIELPTVATPSDDPVQVFKQALATKLKECEVSLRTLQQQKAALKEKVPSEAEERAEKEVLATQIEVASAWNCPSVDKAISDWPHSKHEQIYQNYAKENRKWSVSLTKAQHLKKANEPYLRTR